MKSLQFLFVAIAHGRVDRGQVGVHEVRDFRLTTVVAAEVDGGKWLTRLVWPEMKLANRWRWSSSSSNGDEVLHVVGWLTT